MPSTQENLKYCSQGTNYKQNTIHLQSCDHYGINCYALQLNVHRAVGCCNKLSYSKQPSTHPIH